MAMKWSYAMSLAVAVMGATRPGLALEVEGSPALADPVREAFEGRDDIDAYARVILAPKGKGVAITVILPDGRVAKRWAPQPGDVLATLEPLLLVPAEASSEGGPVPTPSPSPMPNPMPSPSPMPMPNRIPNPMPTPTPNPMLSPMPNRNPTPNPYPYPTSTPEPQPQPISNSPPTTSTTGRDRHVPEDTPHPDRVAATDYGRGIRIELSALTSARIGDGRTGFGIGAASFLDVAGWLLGFSGRADRYGVAGGGEGRSLAIAMLLGRRFRFDSVSLDVFGGPGAAAEEANADQPLTREGSMRPTETHSPGTDTRVVLGSRVNFGARSVFRTFVAIDTEVTTSAIGLQAPSNDLTMPTWTFGLALGATVGTL